MINLFGENVELITRLDIGCGKFKREGFTGVDSIDFGDNIVYDLEKGLPEEIKSGTIEYIIADNLLEHIGNLIVLMNDCYRVLKKDGLFEIIVPLFPTKGAIKDPTHVRFFIEESFDYFDKKWDYEKQPEYGIKKFTVVSKERIGEGDYIYLKVILKK